MIFGFGAGGIGLRRPLDDQRQPGYDFSRTRDHIGRAKRIGLLDHAANLVAHHKQFFSDAVQLAQHEPDLLDAHHLAQIGVDHQNAVGTA